MLHFIPANKNDLKKWLAKLSSNIPISDIDVALLGAQISDLENRCTAMRCRINHKRAEAIPTRQTQHHDLMMGKVPDYLAS
jgi:hypothetical protein